MRCGTHCHLGCPAVILARIATRVVFDCVALYNVLCRHAPPLRWRETAVVFILCWHALPTSHATHAVRGLRQVLLLLFCVLNTPLFYYFVLARIANESCDSCRAGATTSPLIIILCSQHTAFYYLCWHALPTSHATHAVRGLRQVLLLLFCVLNTLLFIICVGTLCQRVMRLMPCGGYDKSSYYYFVFAFYYLCWHALPTSRVTHAVRGLRQVLLLLFCVCNKFLLFTLIIILCLQHTAFLLFPPFLLARNVTVRGSRYSCCLGHRLLFPYMILFKLYICCKKKI